MLVEFDGYYEFTIDGLRFEIIETSGKWGVDGFGVFDSVEDAVEAIKDECTLVEALLARQKAEEYCDWCRA